jgi:hypothetical protein
MELLADGLSGADIATRLVLSPETVRTHIRNAMTKLGASTRSQAVAIALGNSEIAGGSTEEAETADRAERRAQPRQGSGTNGRDPTLEATISSVLADLVSLWDVDGGSIFLADEDGMTLRRAAQAPPGEEEVPRRVALGEGNFGRVALERRPQVVGGSGANATMLAPMVSSGRLVGVLGLSLRASRPVGRREQLLLQAFAGRLGEVIQAGGEEAPSRLRNALERFRFSWAAARH